MESDVSEEVRFHEFAMSLPSYKIAVTGLDIDGQSVTCTGLQIAKVFSAIEELRPAGLWYAGDVDYYGVVPPQLAKSVEPVLIGSTKAMCDFARQVDQFIAGVFFYAHSREDSADWGIAPGTEDDEFRDIGPALLEVRAFDTTTIDVFSSDAAIIKALSRQYKVPIFTEAGLAYGI